MMSPFCKTIYRGSVKLTDLQQLIQYGPARKHSDPALPTHWRVRAQRLSIAMEQGHHPSTPRFMTLPSTWPPKDACFLQPQTVPEDHAGTSHLRAQTSSSAAWTTGPGETHKDADRGGPTVPKPLSLPGPYSQIFEVCGSTKSLSGDGLDGVLTQVPARTKPKGEHCQKRFLQSALMSQGGQAGQTVPRPDTAVSQHLGQCLACKDHWVNICRTNE